MRIFLFLVLSVFAVGQSFSQEHMTYVHVEEWPKLNNKQRLGQVTGVDINSKGQVFVFHRASRNWVTPFPKETIQDDTVFVFDEKSGELINSWGKDLFIMPHGLSIDHEDNIWVTDAGAHQVHKFSPTGELILSLGEAGIAGNSETLFAQPTDVEVLADNTIAISDGYVNSRVVKYTSNGKYITQWGKRGNAAGEFNLPHGITSDSKTLYVADRTNSRIQLFSHQGDFLAMWDRSVVGRPFSMDVGIDGNVYVIAGGDFPYKTTAQVKVIDQKGTLVASFSAVKGSDLRNLGHDISVSQDGSVYVADAWAHTVRKFIPNRP